MTPRTLLLEGTGVRLAPFALEPPRGWERVEVVRAGICGTDLQIAKGLRPERPRVLGHEGLARQAASPGGGARAVLFNPVNAADQDSILGHTYDGIFGETAVIPPPDAGGPGLVEADPRLPLDLAPLVEPLATVLYSRRLLGPAAEESIGIWGAGPTGLLHAIRASRAGARVHLVHGGEGSEWVGAQLGIEVESAVHVKSFEAARALGGGPGLAAATICVPRDGAALALSQALAAVRQGGVIDLFGGFGSGSEHPQLPGVDLGAVRRRNACGAITPAVEAERAAGGTVRLTGHRGTSDTQLREAQELLVAEPETFAPVVTHVVSLATAADWISQRVRGDWPARAVGKVVIDPGRADLRPRGVDTAVLVGGGR